MALSPSHRLHDLLHLRPLGGLWCELEELVEVNRHLIVAIRAVVHQAAIVVCVGERRIQLGGAVERAGGARPVALLGENQAELIVRLREVAGDPDRLLRGGQGCIHVVLYELLAGLADETPRIAFGKRREPRVQLGSLLSSAELLLALSRNVNRRWRRLGPGGLDDLLVLPGLEQSLYVRGILRPGERRQEAGKDDGNVCCAHDAHLRRR